MQTPARTRTYRIYFNRWNDKPLIWSVDEGTQASERIVREVRFENVCGRTHSGPGDNVKSPTVWIEVEAELTIADDVAMFRPPAAARSLLRTRAA
jgi:hypothetical protein